MADTDRCYSIIYADPPWDSNSQFGRDKRKGSTQHYPLLSLDRIKSLDVASAASDDCVLFLWAVDAQLPGALDVIDAWGFKYKTVAFNWVKETSTGKDHFGVGMWTRKNPELCLLATRGKPRRESAAVRQLQRHRIREHSRKPDEIRDEIVRLCGDLPRLDMFARTSAPGWATWGNETTKFKTKRRRRRYA